MTVVGIVSVLVAFLMAASRLLTTAKPLWNMVPAKLRVWVPVVAMVFPQLVEKAADAKTPVDLANLGVLAAALLIPGAKARDHDGDGIPDDEEEG